MPTGLRSQSATHPKFEKLTSRRESTSFLCAPSLRKFGAYGSVEANSLWLWDYIRSISDAREGEECHDEHCEGGHGILVSTQDLRSVAGSDNDNSVDSGGRSGNGGSGGRGDGGDSGDCGGSGGSGGSGESGGNGDSEESRDRKYIWTAHAEFMKLTRFTRDHDRNSEAYLTDVRNRFLTAGYAGYVKGVVNRDITEK